MVRLLTTLGYQFEARVLVARLGPTRASCGSCGVVTTARTRWGRSTSTYSKPTTWRRPTRSSRPPTTTTRTHDPDLDPDGAGDAHDGRAPLALWLIVLAIVAMAAFGIARVAMSSDACVHDGTGGTVRCTDQPQPAIP